MADPDTPPKSAASLAISQLLRVEVGRSTSRMVGASFSGEFRQCVLRGRKLASPVFLIAQFFEQPASDTVLFLGRKRRKLGDGRIKRKTTSGPTCAGADAALSSVVRCRRATRLSAEHYADKNRTSELIK